MWIVVTACIRRMGKVMFSVCPHLGGYTYPIMLCNITQTPRGVPGQVQPEGVPCQGVPCEGGTLPGGTLLGGTQIGYPLCQVRMGVPWRRLYPGRVPPGQVRMGGTLPGGYPVRTTEGVLTTRRAVCLLHSCRRTFLLRVFLRSFFTTLTSQPCVHWQSVNSLASLNISY